MTLKEEEINAIKLSKILLNVVTKIFHDGIKQNYPECIQHLRSCCDKNSPQRNYNTESVYEQFEKSNKII
jgi:hypothetical protein